MKARLTRNIWPHRYWFTVIRISMVVVVFAALSVLSRSLAWIPAAKYSEAELVAMVVVGVCIGAMLQVRAISDARFIESYGYALRQWFLLAFSKGHTDFLSTVSGWSAGVFLFAWFSHDWTKLLGIPGYVVMILAARVGSEGPVNFTAKQP